MFLAKPIFGLVGYKYRADQPKDRWYIRAYPHFYESTDVTREGYIPGINFFMVVMILER